MEELEHYTLPVTQNIISTEILEEFEGKLKIEYYWDSHGKLVPFETESHKNFTVSGKFRLEEETKETFYDGKSIGVFTCWKLYCNNELIATDVYELKKTKAKVVIGWG